MSLMLCTTLYTVRALFELSAPSSAGVLVSYFILAYVVKCAVFFFRRHVNKLKKKIKKVYVH